ncbi:MAG: carbonic anhydrase [Planctomycetaceae bacterium]|nr:carbonic anhydrase [Planctomycetaceae bacterium]
MLARSRSVTRAIFLIALLSAAPLGAEPVAAPTVAPMTPQQALDDLKAGNLRFADDGLREAKLGSKRRIQLAQGQHPMSVVLTCSDSRAAPEIIFDQGLGEIFVVRVAGNVGGPEVYASIEYAVAELKAPLVVVLGHTHCGAVATALKAKELPSYNLKLLIGLVNVGENLPKNPELALAAAIRNNVREQTLYLTQQSEIIRRAAKGGQIMIVPALYDLESGRVTWGNPGESSIAEVNAATVDANVPASAAK